MATGVETRIEKRLQDIWSGTSETDAETCRTRVKKDAPFGAAGPGCRLPRSEESSEHRIRFCLNILYFLLGTQDAAERKTERTNLLQEVHRSEERRVGKESRSQWS